MEILQQVYVYKWGVVLLNSCCKHTEDVDYDSGPYSVTLAVITPRRLNRRSTGTVHIPMINDEILEGTETFNTRINIDGLLPKDVNINVGTIGSTTITIVDTTGECCSSVLYCVVIVICLQYLPPSLNILTQQLYMRVHQSLYHVKLQLVVPSHISGGEVVER